MAGDQSLKTCFGLRSLPRPSALKFLSTSPRPVGRSPTGGTFRSLPRGEQTIQMLESRIREYPARKTVPPCYRCGYSFFHFGSAAAGRRSRTDFGDGHASITCRFYGCEGRGIGVEEGGAGGDWRANRSLTRLDGRRPQSYIEPLQTTARTSSVYSFSTRLPAVRSLSLLHLAPIPRSPRGRYTTRRPGRPRPGVRAVPAAPPAAATFPPADCFSSAPRWGETCGDRDLSSLSALKSCPASRGVLTGNSPVDVPADYT